MMKYISIVLPALSLALLLHSAQVSARDTGDQNQAYTSERNSDNSNCRLGAYAINLLQTGVFPVYNNGANPNYRVGNAYIQLLNYYRFTGRDQYNQDQLRQSQSIDFARIKSVSNILSQLRNKKYSGDLSLTMDMRKRGEAIKADLQLRRYIRSNCGSLFTLNSGNYYRPDPREQSPTPHITPLTNPKQND